MEDGVRVLRDGRVGDSPAPFALIEDDVVCIGGPPLVLQIIRRLATLWSSQNVPVTFLVLGRPRWVAECNMEDKTPFQVVSIGGAEFSAPDLTSLHKALAASSSEKDSHCVVLESLTTLLLRTTLGTVIQLLDSLSKLPAVRCCIGLLHRDLVDKASAFALKRAAKCIFSLQQAQPGLRPADSSTGHDRIDTALVVEYKKRTGRVQRKREWIQLLPDGGVQCFRNVVSSAQQAHTHTASSNNAASASTQPQVGMRWTLSPEEAAAREAVALPYERAAEAQGKEEAGGGLGKILYVRDSASEYDSDEDPDDDLDF